jgi:hypothetical protein
MYSNKAHLCIEEVLGLVDAAQNIRRLLTLMLFHFEWLPEGVLTEM